MKNGISLLKRVGKVILTALIALFVGYLLFTLSRF